MAALRYNVNIVLSQKDYFENNRRISKNKVLILRNNIRYLALDDVLEILEYDISRRNTLNLVATDGSEFVTIPLKSGISKREGVSYRIDPLISNQRKLYLSFRSINRMFNVDLSTNLTKKQVFIKQPGQFFIAFRGDTLRSISMILNTTVKKLLALNKNLKEPIATGTRIRIPTIRFDLDRVKRKPTKVTVKIKQTDIAPAIIALGRSLRGTPYLFGAGPYPRTRKFDCSSYIQYIFGRNGVQLPRTSRAQAMVGKAIRQIDIEPGDLIFFRRDRYSDNRVGHVGIDIGNGRMLNTYRSPPGVTVTHWKSPYWLKRYVVAREIL